MSIEVTPLGMKCASKCTYCYQEPVRDAGNEEPESYDMDAMKASLRDEGWKFTVFGGEPLLIPIDDLAELWRFGYDEMGKQSREEGGRSNGIQTGAIQLTAKHIKLMIRYDVGVGVSLDGPKECNDARQFGPDLASTRKSTVTANRNLRKLMRELPTPPSLIVTLHNLNGTAERLPLLLKWLEDLRALGLRHVNVHLLERDTVASTALMLTDEETIEAYHQLWLLGKRTGLTVAPLDDMLSLMLGKDKNTSCIWNGCDPYTTEAVRGVGPDGEKLNCGRTYKQGIMAIKSDTASFERYLQLYYSPQSTNGCSGCRFFALCKGNCPGTAESGDWRMRTEHCAILMGIFGFIEADLVSQGQVPFSLDPRRETIEKMMIEQWTAGTRPTIEYTTEAFGRGDTYGGVGNPGHQDIPHGDWHGDNEEEHYD